MTVIVYRDGVMASDTGASCSQGSHSWAKKLIRADDGTLYGGSGYYASVCEYLKWVESGCKETERIPRTLQNENQDEFNIMKVGRVGGIEILTSYGWEVYAAPYMAMGSGAATAMGALYMGATAVEAVRACLEHGDGVYGEIMSITRNGR